VKLCRENVPNPPEGFVPDFIVRMSRDEAIHLYDALDDYLASIRIRTSWNRGKRRVSRTLKGLINRGFKE